MPIKAKPETPETPETADELTLAELKALPKMRSCQFCGGSAYHKVTGRLVQVRCSVCGSRGPRVIPAKQEALATVAVVSIGKWNRGRPKL